MLETTHVLAALALAKNIENPWLAFGVGLASHLILDAIPHYDFQGKILKPEFYQNKAVSAADKTGTLRPGRAEFSTMGKVVILSDLTASFLIFLFLSLTGKIWPDFPNPVSFFFFLLSNFSLVAGVFGGLLPDLMNLISLGTGFCRPAWFFEFHKKIQQSSVKPGSWAEPRINPVLGLAFQVLLIAVSLYYFFIS